MHRNVVVNYPKKRKKLDASKLTGIQEPVRKTVYDNVLENFKIIERTTYIHRIIYVGEHSFPKGNELIVDVFRAVINQINSGDCLESLTGFLLYYNRYFMHMVEGDEDSLNKHIAVLLQNEYSKNLGTTKLLIHVSHINKRFIPDWNYYYGTPSKLMGELKHDCSLEDSGRQIYSCIKKIYNTIASFVEDNYMPDSPVDSKRSTFGSKENSSGELMAGARGISGGTRGGSLPSISALSIATSMGGRDPYRLNLPEVELIAFVLNSSFTVDLKDYYALYGVVPQRDIYKDKVWPVPSDFIPYDVFQKPFDTCTELLKKDYKKSSSTTTLPEEDQASVMTYTHAEDDV